MQCVLSYDSPFNAVISDFYKCFWKQQGIMTIIIIMMMMIIIIINSKTFVQYLKLWGFKIP